MDKNKAPGLNPGADGCGMRPVLNIGAAGAGWRAGQVVAGALEVMRVPTPQLITTLPLICKHHPNFFCFLPGISHIMGIHPPPPPTYPKLLYPGFVYHFQSWPIPGYQPARYSGNHHSRYHHCNFTSHTPPVSQTLNLKSNPCHLLRQHHPHQVGFRCPRHIQKRKVCLSNYYRHRFIFNFIYLILHFRQNITRK